MASAFYSPLKLFSTKSLKTSSWQNLSTCTPRIKWLKDQLSVAFPICDWLNWHQCILHWSNCLISRLLANPTNSQILDSNIWNHCFHHASHVFFLAVYGQKRKLLFYMSSGAYGKVCYLVVSVAMNSSSVWYTESFCLWY